MIIRFIQQPQQIAFDSVDREQFRRYLASRNVQEFVTAGKTVHVSTAFGKAIEFMCDLSPDHCDVGMVWRDERIKGGKTWPA